MGRRDKLEPGWSWWKNVAVPTEIEKYYDEKERAKAEEEKALEKARKEAQATEDQTDHANDNQAPQELIGLNEGFQLYQANELQALLSDAERQPDDAKSMLKNHLKAVKKLGSLRRLAKAPELTAIVELRKRFPNFSAVLDLVERESRWLIWREIVFALCLPF